MRSMDMAPVKPEARDQPPPGVKTIPKSFFYFRRKGTGFSMGEEMANAPLEQDVSVGTEEYVGALYLTEAIRTAALRKNLELLKTLYYGIVAREGTVIRHRSEFAGDNGIFVVFKVTANGLLCCRAFHCFAPGSDQWGTIKLVGGFEQVCLWDLKEFDVVPTEPICPLELRSRLPRKHDRPKFYNWQWQITGPDTSILKDSCDQGFNWLTPQQMLDLLRFLRLGSGDRMPSLAEQILVALIHIIHPDHSEEQIDEILKLRTKLVPENKKLQSPVTDPSSEALSKKFLDLEEQEDLKEVKEQKEKLERKRKAFGEFLAERRAKRARGGNAAAGGGCPGDNDDTPVMLVADGLCLREALGSCYCHVCNPPPLQEPVRLRERGMDEGHIGGGGGGGGGGGPRNRVPKEVPEGAFSEEQAAEWAPPDCKIKCPGGKMWTGTYTNRVPPGPLSRSRRLYKDITVPKELGSSYTSMMHCLGWLWKRHIERFPGTECPYSNIIMEAGM
jgi:hypothetical protein